MVSAEDEKKLNTKSICAETAAQMLFVRPMRQLALFRSLAYSCLEAVRLQAANGSQKTFVDADSRLSGATSLIKHFSSADEE